MKRTVEWTDVLEFFLLRLEAAVALGDVAHASLLTRLTMDLERHLEVDQ